MSRRLINGSRILLTGASSGIGRALALELAAEGADLLLLARREKLLAELEEQIHGQNSGEKSKIIRIVGDITDPEVRKKAVQSAVEQFGGLDYLINNAGVGATSLIEEAPEELSRRLMDVNYFSALELTRTALEHLKRSAQDPERKSGKIHPMIVFLGSIVGLRGVPHYGNYGAAKFAITCLSEALRAELSRDGIEVLLVSPGTTKTEFFDSLLQNSSAPNMPEHTMVSSESVAKKIVSAMKKGKRRIIPYFPAQILDRLNRFFPGLTDRILGRYV